MRTLLTVPYYSQKINVSDLKWKDRACGILSLKMMLDFLGVKTSSTDVFIQEGVDANAYGEWGWTHEGLVFVAKQYGVALERKEFRSQDSVTAEKLLNIGVNKIISSIENKKPVLVSAIKRWVETKKFHMMVIVGFEMDEGVLKGFYYHDPDAFIESEGKDLFIDILTFKKYWRRMAIFSSF